MKRLILICAISGPLLAIDNAHFYRGNFFWQEPRFERAWLSSFDFSLGGVSSHVHGRGCNGENTTLLNIYGLQDIHHLAAGVSGLDPANTLDAALIALNNLPDRDSFGLLKYAGEFSCEEVVFDIKQNLFKHVFTQFYLPVRTLKINNIVYSDESPRDTGFPNANTPQWNTVLQSLNAILQRYGLSTQAIKSRGLGDATLLVGITRNFQNAYYLDFIDATVKGGILFPTGRKRDESHVFDLPTGYNGHWAFSGHIEAALGMWEWFTFGCNGGALAFFENEQCIHMKTDIRQNGYIKLGQGQARIKPGTIWYAGWYTKIDHAYHLFSLLLGYSFNRKNKDRVVAHNGGVFPCAVVNADNMLGSWTMQTLHLSVELDLARTQQRAHPRIGIYLNIPVAGRRIFDATAGGFTGGLDITWYLL